MSAVRINLPPRLIESARAAQYANRESLGSRELEQRIKKRAKIKAVQERKKNLLAQQEREGGQLEFERKNNYKIWTRRRKPLLGIGWLLSPRQYSGDLIPVESAGEFEHLRFATSNHTRIYFLPEARSFLVVNRFMHERPDGIVPGYASNRITPGNRFSLAGNSGNSDGLFVGTNITKLTNMQWSDAEPKPLKPGSTLVRLTLDEELGLVLLKEWFYWDRQWQYDFGGDICYGILSYIFDKNMQIVALTEIVKEESPFRGYEFATKNGGVISKVSSVFDVPTKEWTLEFIIKLPPIRQNTFPLDEERREDLTVTHSKSYFTNSFYSQLTLFGHNLQGARVPIIKIESVHDGMLEPTSYWGLSPDYARLPAAGGTHHLTFQNKGGYRTTLFVNGAVRANFANLQWLDFASGITIVSTSYQYERRASYSWTTNWPGDAVLTTSHMTYYDRIPRLDLYHNDSLVASESEKYTPAPSYCIGFHGLRFTPSAIYNDDGFNPPSRITSLYDA